jgi:hypothetical protein
VENIKKNQMYDSQSEKELIKMWEDIKGNNTKSLNRSLMKKIANNEQGPLQEEEREILYAKQMWDSELGEWVPFDLWGAHFIVNERKEYVQLRIYRPVDIQPEYGPTLKGWQSIDSSYLNEQLKEKKVGYEKFNQFNLFSGRQAFYEMVKQDRQEYKDEGRHQEINIGRI